MTSERRFCGNMAGFYAYDDFKKFLDLQEGSRLVRGIENTVKKSFNYWLKPGVTLIANYYRRMTPRLGLPLWSMDLTLKGEEEGLDTVEEIINNAARQF